MIGRLYGYWDNLQGLIVPPTCRNLEGSAGKGQRAGRKCGPETTEPRFEAPHAIRLSSSLRNSGPPRARLSSMRPCSIEELEKDHSPRTWQHFVRRGFITVQFDARNRIPPCSGTAARSPIGLSNRLQESRSPCRLRASHRPPPRRHGRPNQPCMCVTG